MRLNHCRRNIIMAQEFLHGPDVVVGLQEVRRK